MVRVRVELHYWVMQFLWGKILLRIIIGGQRELRPTPLHTCHPNCLDTLCYMHISSDLKVITEMQHIPVIFILRGAWCGNNPGATEIVRT